VIARSLWLMSFALFTGVGVGIVWWPASQTVAELRSAAANDYDEASRNDDAVRQAARFRLMHRKVVDDLKSITPLDNTAAATAHMLQLLNAEEKSYRIAVRSVVPNNGSSGATTPASAKSEPFDRTDVEISLTGEFSNILHFVADLPRHGVLLEMHDITVRGNGGVDDARVLSVTLQATLYRFRGPIPQEDSDAPGSL
jgi:hypothetical protein